MLRFLNASFVFNVVFTIVFMIAFIKLAHASGPVYLDPSAPVEIRIDDLMPRMTTAEKLRMLYGSSTLEMQSNGVPRLKIPGVRMTDGPLGTRWDLATAFPAGVLLGASFNPTLIGQVGATIAREARAQGRDMLLGPNININRIPIGGRAFESYGEDPYLTSALAREYIRGVQGQKVIATPKHFALNDEEFRRKYVNVEADERTMNEIYFAPFKAAIDAGAWSIMSAYNRTNGLYCSENPSLLTDVLRTQWGFQGFVVSDWGATHSTVASANAGLDIEMPDDQYFGIGLATAVQNGDVSIATIDAKVHRILRALFSTGIFDEKDQDRPPTSEIGSSQNAALALKVAEEGIVLLKNDSNILPLKNLRKIAVIGPNSGILRSLGGGSAEALSNRHVSPLDALKERLQGSGTQVVYAPGPIEANDYPMLTPPILQDLKSEFYATKNLSGGVKYSETPTNLDFHWDDAPDDSVSGKAYSFTVTGKMKFPTSGFYDLAVAPGNEDKFQLLINGHVVSENLNAGSNSIAHVQFAANTAVKFTLKFFHQNAGDIVSLHMGYIASRGNLMQDAINTAKASDAAVIYAGLSDLFETEGEDRESMALPNDQSKLIQAIAEVNPNTVVVINSGNPVLIEPWLGSVKGLVQAWYPGQEGGYAMADVLLGLVNPSGKLPVSFPKRWEDSPAYASYPKISTESRIRYKEGIYVGYRYFDRSAVQPLFPFGFGLSYSKFAFSNLNVTSNDLSVAHPDIDVTVDLQNQGPLAGAEVAELYIRANTPGVHRPYQELKGFTKTMLSVGETSTAHFKLDEKAFQYYDVSIHGWRVAPGDYDIAIGNSSRDIYVEKTIHLQ